VAQPCLRVISLSLSLFLKVPLPPLPQGLFTIYWELSEFFLPKNQKKLYYKEKKNPRLKKKHCPYTKYISGVKEKAPLLLLKQNHNIWKFYQIFYTREQPKTRQFGKIQFPLRKFCSLLPLPTFPLALIPRTVGRTALFPIHPFSYTEIK